MGIQISIGGNDGGHAGTDIIPLYNRRMPHTHALHIGYGIHLTGLKHTNYNTGITRAGSGVQLRRHERRAANKNQQG
ncbi:MAG: hypothetical protein DHS20C12_03060 [Pseudohongiella sp.]|nr:MAG: hypothetical protein DHS20C12_03060 [Pseudohongiella sp.]